VLTIAISVAAWVFGRFLGGLIDLVSGFRDGGRR